MPDPSRDMLELIREMDGREISPPILLEVRDRIDQFGWCVLSGPPRTGKTTLAIILADKLIGSNNAKASYLDLGGLSSAEQVADIKQPFFDKGRLFVVDNWHLCPSAHEALLARLLPAYARGLRVLLISTQHRFWDPSSPRLALPTRPDPERNPAIDMRDGLGDLARLLVFHRLRRAVAENESLPFSQDQVRVFREKYQFHVDEEDISQALSGPLGKKQILGHLRYLTWRLDAWNPDRQHLKEVSFEDVLDRVDSELCEPNAAQGGTLEKIASVTQWELPYRLAPGENPPSDLRSLSGRNLVSPLPSKKGWVMDTTDAYLIMEASSRNRWLDQSASLLLDYIKTRPGDAPPLIHRIMAHGFCDKETTENLLTRLLGDEAIRKCFIEEVIAMNRGGRRILNLMGNVLRFFMRARWEARIASEEERLAILNMLFASPIPELLAQGIQRERPVRFAYFLSDLAKGKESLAPVAASLLAHCREEDLVILIEKANDRNTQQTILNHVNRHDSELRKRVQAAANLKPGFTAPPDAEGPLNWKQVLSWLTAGGTKGFKGRAKRRDFILGLNLDRLLESLNEPEKTVKHLQQLLDVSLWFRRSAAQHSVDLALSALEELPDLRASASQWGYLLFNAAHSDPTTAREILARMTRRPIGDSIPVEESGKLFTFMKVVEALQPGTIGEWCAGQADYFAAAFDAQGDEEMRDGLLLSLALFLPASLDALLDGGAASSPGRFNSWRRVGILALHGLEPPAAPDLSFAQALDSTKLQLAASAFHGIQTAASLDLALAALAEHNAAGQAGPALPLFLGRFRLPQSSRDLADAIRESMRRSTHPCWNAVDGVLALAFSKGVLHKDRFWPRQMALAFSLAINENSLNLDKVVSEYGGVYASLNPEHPQVQQMTTRLNALLDTLPPEGAALEAWNAALPELKAKTNWDYWRIKLMETGRVGWKVDLARPASPIVFTRESPA